MPDGYQVSVGDRVNVQGQDGVFFVLDLNRESRSASLLPSNSGPILNKISVDVLRLLPETAFRQIASGLTRLG
jgi:hypothetical protein